MQRWHLFVSGEYGLACRTVFHEIVGFKFLSLSFQYSVDRVVLCLYRSSLKDVLWLLYRCLKVFWHSPMYFLSWFGMSDESVASYMMLVVWQSRCNGQLFLFVQLHVFGLLCVSVGEIMRLL